MPRILNSEVQSATSSFTGPEPCTCSVTRALLVGAEQDVEGGGVAKKRRDVLRVVPAVEHPLPGSREAGEAPADVEVLEQEALNVVGLHGQKYSHCGRSLECVVIKDIP